MYANGRFWKAKLNLEHTLVLDMPSQPVEHRYVRFLQGDFWRVPSLIRSLFWEEIGQPKRPEQTFFRAWFTWLLANPQEKWQNPKNSMVFLKKRHKTGSGMG